LKKHSKIFESCEEWWDNLESSLRKLMNPIQTRILRRAMKISVSQSVKRTLATYNMSEDFRVSRATLLHSQKAACYKPQIPPRDGAYGQPCRTQHPCCPSQ
jgi:hypothetical protein